MKIAIILGYWLNDDGHIANRLKERLDMGIKLYHDYHPDKIIVSGGVANKKAGVSEASQMKAYLVQNMIPEDIIIMEDKSQSTYENAKFSIPIAMEYNPDTIILCTSIEHLAREPYNTLLYFSDWLNEVDPRLPEEEKKAKRKHKNINFIVYTNC